MATYYISTTGNDSTGVGSIGNPWKTLFKATSTVTTSGDIIHIISGTYTETVQSTLAVGVSIEGDAKATTIIKSTISAANTALIVAASSEGTNGNQHISEITLDGNNRTTKWGLEIKGRSNFSVHDCIIQDFDQRGVMWSGRNDNAPGAPGIYATGNTFYNNTVTNCASYVNPTGYGCLMVGGQDGMQIYGNIITQLGRTTGTNGWPIKYANDGYLNGCRIYNNTITKEPFDGTSWDFALELFNVQGLEIDHNTIIGSTDLNYQDLGSYSYSVYFHDNIVGPSTLQLQYERGIIFEYQCYTCRVENNTFRNLWNPIYYSARALTPINNNTISGNLCYNIGTTAGLNEGWAVRFKSDGSASYTVSNLKVYNNTFIGHSTALASFGVDFSDSASVSSSEIKNNLFQNFNYSYLFGDPGVSINGLQVYNNDIYNCGFSNGDHYVGGSPTSITYSGNFSSAPNLDGSYHPNVGSPLIDAGVNVGLSFSGSAPDIGYFETGGNSNPTADAGIDQILMLPTTSATLVGTATDSDGTIVSTLWSQISGPNSATIVSASNLTTSITGLIVGNYVFQLLTTDNNGGTSTDTIQIFVNPILTKIKRKIIIL